MAQIYTFTSMLLSAEKTGSPNLLNTTLSGTGVTYLSGSGVSFDTQKVVVLSLSTNDVGICFNPSNITIGAESLSTFDISSYPLSSINVGGSVFVIPTYLNEQTMAVLKTDNTFLTFPFLSSVAVVPTSAFAITDNVSSPDTRRKWLYGYC